MLGTRSVSRPRVPRVAVTCPRCGAVRLYYVSAAAALAGSVCSACRRAPKVLLVCPVCNRQWRVLPSAALQRKSTRCHPCAVRASLAERRARPGPGLIDAALSIVEAGGCLDGAGVASVREPEVVSRETRSPRPPSWPEHSGGRERLSGQCFKDVVPRSRGRA